MKKNQENRRCGFRDQPGRTNARTDEWTDARTDRGDFIDPFGFQPGTNKLKNVLKQVNSRLVPNLRSSIT